MLSDRAAAGSVDGRNGTFRYVYNRPVYPGIPPYVEGMLTILKGTGDLANLHGVLDLANPIFPLFALLERKVLEWVGGLSPGGMTRSALAL